MAKATAALFSRIRGARRGVLYEAFEDDRSVTVSHRGKRSAAQRPRPIATARCLAAETIGTFWLVLGGCGAAVLAAGTSVPGSIGLVGVSMAFAVGFISGGHFNPAVTLGLIVAGRFPARNLPGFAHTDEDRSPCPIGNTPVEMLVSDDRSSTGGDRA